MAEFPTELRYLKSHEWVKQEGDMVVVGISDHAQDALGDVVYVELPEVAAECQAGDEIAVVESVKAASDLVAPVSGSIIEVNSRLEDEPEIVTEDSMGEGWFIKVKLSNPEELNDLLDEDAYNKFIED